MGADAMTTVTDVPAMMEEGTTVTDVPTMGSDDATTTSMAPVVLVDDARVGLIRCICQT